ncbi:MAG: hypothetical protein NW201_12595 [Gemmatimonadales bacterium]|nr:hypothetical protein [Gemmatimonadales bacterium]
MDSSAATLGALGFLLGMRHALDPDHVVAVSAMAARTRSVRRLALVAALWGVGHALTILVAGGTIILAKVAVAPRVALGLEFGVAIMLVLLGLANLRTSGDATGAHAHPHPHAEAPAEVPLPLRSLAVGMVHGLAGSAAIALLVVSTVPEPRWALAYLLLFGAGTVAGMVAATTVVGGPAVIAAERMVPVRRWLTYGAGVASLAFGLYLAVELAGAGLFGANPSWTPQ